MKHGRVGGQEREATIVVSDSCLCSAAKEAGKGCVAPSLSGRPLRQGRRPRPAPCRRAPPSLLGLRLHGPQQLPRAPLPLARTRSALQNGSPGRLWKGWRLREGDKVLLLRAGAGAWFKLKTRRRRPVWSLAARGGGPRSYEGETVGNQRSLSAKTPKRACNPLL